jgi:hypothetical protein
VQLCWQYSWWIFFLHDVAFAHKAAIVCQFFTPKRLQPLITPLLSIFISARLFSVPKVENEVKRDQFCGCCSDPTDEIKKVQKEEFSAAFQKLYDHAKAYKNANGAHFELKTVRVSSISKKASPKAFGPHCVQTVFLMMSP